MYRGVKMLSIKENQICIRSFLKIIEISEEKIVVKCQGYTLCMLGRNFHIIALEQDEMHLEGRLNSLFMEYEK